MCPESFGWVRFDIILCKPQLVVITIEKLSNTNKYWRFNSPIPSGYWRVNCPILVSDKVI